MIRALRRRFIRGAMLALVILVALMIGGSTAASWIQFDRSVEQRMDAVLSGTDTDARHKADDAPRLALFGPFSSRSGARLVTMTFAKRLSSGAASSTCSKLSTTSSTSPSW